MGLFDGGIRFDDDFFGGLLQNNMEEDDYAFPWSSSENLTSSQIPANQNGTRKLLLPEAPVDTRSGVQAGGRNIGMINGTSYQNQLAPRAEQSVTISNVDPAKEKKRKRDREYRQQQKEGKEELRKLIAELHEKVQSLELKKDRKGLMNMMNGFPSVEMRNLVTSVLPPSLTKQEADNKKEHMEKKKVEEDLQRVMEKLERFQNQQIVPKQRIGTVLQETVLRLDIDDANIKQKAMKVVVDFSGSKIDSIAADVKEKKLTITGDVDVFDIVSELKKKVCQNVVIESVIRPETVLLEKNLLPSGADNVTGVTILKELREVCRTEIVAVKLAREEKMLTVNGDVDFISLFSELREVCRKQIVAVRQATEEKKTEEKKLIIIANDFDAVGGIKIKHEGKKCEGKKDPQTQEVLSELKKLCITGE